MKRFTVIIMSWHVKGHANVMERTEKQFTCFHEAMLYGNKAVVKGVCVIVRPNYNETDINGSFYREWRGIDGATLAETIFRF